MEKNMQPQVKTEEDKLVPIDTSGESMDIEIKDEEEKIESDEQQIEEKDVEDKSDEKKETSEEEEYSQNVKKRIDILKNTPLGSLQSWTKLKMHYLKQ
jgi:hypothetical protein